jgi:O-methyltransferase involved in polyketide biosynthesis
MNNLPADRLTLILAEGLFPYLDAAVVESTIRDMVEYFGSGELVFGRDGNLDRPLQRLLEALPGHQTSRSSRASTTSARSRSCTRS